MCAIKLVNVIVMLCCLELFGAADALKPGGQGVCQVKTSFQKTRWKSYYAQTKKMCGRKKCVVKKSKKETFTATRNQTVCCNGWQYAAEDDSCAPLCSTGCSGGRCILPDVCHCVPPATLDEEHKNACILPTCDPPCVNSACVANDTCECFAGFKAHNSTHCYHCDPGYVIGEDFSCVPVCETPCSNGNCIGPNVCGCTAGFRLKDAFTCEPVCERPCVNSVCTAPNVCSCLDGYIEANETCVPRCDSCTNGRCVAPNVCDCDDGYRGVNGSCVPACERTCMNGFCSAPNVCTCNDGYSMGDGGFNCYKPCDEQCLDACDEHGKCIDCSVPLRQSNDPRRPDKLYCCNNWKYDAKQKKCVFHCRLGCGEGKCVGPNRCSCDPPNVMVADKCVKPTCEPSCVNATCTGHNCTCSAGYEKINATHCAPTCRTGYKRPCANGACEKPTVEADPLACVPICEPNCTNGICTEPGVCQCHEGFANTSRWHCDPVCDGCEHGACVAPNKCICDEGYSMRGGRCVPDCESCVNGVCTAPGVCNCTDGYNATVGAEGSCSPVCVKPCVNADCVAPNRCKCAPGFVKDAERQTVCYKPCENFCGNGTCTNGNCECHLGYKMENGTCVALPPVPCKDCDGNCTDDGLCFCSDKSPCFNFIAEPAEIASSARLAGLEITWLVGAVVGLLILTLMIVIISYMWRKRKEYGAKPAEERGMYNQSVVYTVSNTLLQNRDEVTQENEYDIPKEKGQNEGAGENLLDGTVVRNDKMYD